MDITHSQRNSLLEIRVTGFLNGQGPLLFGLAVQHQSLLDSKVAKCPVCDSVLTVAVSSAEFECVWTESSVLKSVCIQLSLFLLPPNCLSVVWSLVSLLRSCLYSPLSALFYCLLIVLSHSEAVLHLMQTEPFLLLLLHIKSFPSVDWRDAGTQDEWFTEQRCTLLPTKEECYRQKNSHSELKGAAGDRLILFCDLQHDKASYTT